MKSSPILMNQEMIRAYMAGQKTQTRRIVKNVPAGTDYYHPGWCPKGDRAFTPYKRTDDIERPERLGKYIKCPYGQPGDELWFRETFRIGAHKSGILQNDSFAFDYKASPEIKSTPWMYCENEELAQRYQYQLIEDFLEAEKTGVPKVWREEPKKYNWERGFSPCRWRPSIHMPKWASRFRPKITGIRVERVQDISAQDAMDEGIGHMYGYDKLWPAADAVRRFAELWNSINEKRGYPWESNPWVWVIEFERYDR